MDHCFRHGNIIVGEKMPKLEHARNPAERRKSSELKVMEARSASSLPEGPEWQYEPKWDGFRCLIVRDGADVRLWSKSQQELTRYFPEMKAAAQKLRKSRFILDGELVIPIGTNFSFDALLQRIHPAASRVSRLATETPARYLAFDLLRTPRSELAGKPLLIRRPALEEFAASAFRETGLFSLSPSTRNYTVATGWLAFAGGGFDGVIAKRNDLPYQHGNRDGMLKIKRLRSADCVVGGYRYAKGHAKKRIVGSLLLGLYDEDGKLNHVGFTSALSLDEKIRLTPSLERLVTKQSFTGESPGGPSRWSKQSAEWQPVKPRLVVEVSYDHFTGGRFRHGTAILRWRPDKPPHQCTTEQLHQKIVAPAQLLGVGKTTGDGGKK
jgi:ATP-dependent DNA ligase